MLKKLLKYDLKYVCKILILLYCLTIFCAIGSRIFSFSNNGLFIFSIIGTILKFLTYSMIAATLMYNMTRLWIRFKSSVYGDESYLTHTLPITKKDIYLSKILTAVITVTASILVSLIAVYIINGIPHLFSSQMYNLITDPSVMTEESLNQMIQETIDENQQLAIHDYKSTISSYFIIWFFILIFFIWIALTGYFAIITGNYTNKNKKTESLVLGIAFFFLCISINYLIFFIFNLFGKDSFTQAEIYLIVITYYSLISILYYVIGMKQLKNDINII